MKNVVAVLSFGAPYLKQYWARLVAGLLLGILFGASNVAILGTSKLLLNRVFPESAALAEESPRPATGLSSRLDAFAEGAKESISRAVDSWLPAAGREVDWKQILSILILFPLLFAVRGYVGFLSSYCLRWVSERLVRDLRRDAFAKLSSLSVAFYNRSKMGDLVTHVFGDTNSVQRSLSIGMSDLVKEPITIIGTLLFIVWIDWQLTLFVMMFLPVCIIPMMILGKKVRKATKENRKQGAGQASLLIEAIGGIRLIKAFSLEDYQMKRFAEFSRQHLHHSMKSVRAKELINPLIETIGAFGVGILLLYILLTHKSGADLAIFLAAVMTVYTPIKKLGRIHVLFQEAGVGVERLMSLLSQKATVVEPVNPLTPKPFAREIRFENVTFSYDDRIVLRNFNLVIPRGMKLGVAGESGSGKSTLVNLLFRFYDPQEGRVLIDGEDIRNFSTQDLRRQMALVSQEVIIFNQSAFENIACGKTHATREEVEIAAQAAFAEEFISKLPEGYDTQLGDRGVLLSGGQRQRIAIARAFVRGAPILALDEATAALDVESEAQVQKAIDRLAEHRTVISVAHRLSTLANMDKIIVLREGKIVEEGTFAELVRGKGIFGAMASRQTFMPAATS